MSKPSCECGFPKCVDDCVLSDVAFGSPIRLNKTAASHHQRPTARWIRSDLRRPCAAADGLLDNTTYDYVTQYYCNATVISQLYYTLL